MADLEEAIQVVQKVINATPQDHSSLAKYLCHLGIRLSNRYFKTGAIVDLEEAT